MDDLVFLAVGVGAAAAVLMMTFMLIRMRNDMRNGLPENVKATPERRAEEVCGICFGEIQRYEKVCRCACGQTFHDSCAGPTGACPYCKAPYGDLAVESRGRVTCPSCGSGVTGNVCGCGAVVNRDGAFTCVCGSPLDINEPVCGRCGREYDVCSGRRQK